MARKFGPGVRVVQRRPVSGGDISTAALLALSNGKRVFIKENRAELAPMFSAELRGLEALAEVASRSAAPPVPQALATGVDRGRSFLLLSEISTGRPASGAAFGRALAELHRSGRRDSCGFDEDNWIGSTPQKNPWTVDWFDFFAHHRLGFQWSLARRNGYGDRSADSHMESLQRRLPQLIPDVDDGRASLLHGDLWGGNWMAALDGRAWLIDPAVYYGHREADIAMTQLFGGFPAGFHSAWDEAWPKEPGFDKRRDIYNLYHLLNHLNLFGSSYWGGVEDILRRYA